MVALIDLIIFLGRDTFYFQNSGIAVAGCIGMVLYPLVYLSWNTQNDCCGAAPFANEHLLSIIILIGSYCLSFTYCLLRKRIYSPIIEVCANTFLIIGIILNVVVAIHTESYILALIGNLPGILIMSNVLVRNHVFLLNEINPIGKKERNIFEKIAFKILYLPAFKKFPLLIVLCLPVLSILISFLLLFGQKPDSLILAFTQTYKHGFSQLDYQCNNVQCGGHYLCSVAANGHSDIVKPQRLGVRHGNTIICNRQLLISNAFEELLAEKTPTLHKIIRTNYNKVGNVVHKYYWVFNNKYVSDVIYILMKPAECFFIATLYTFDSKPENRIASQYLKAEDREVIKYVTTNSKILPTKN